MDPKFRIAAITDEYSADLDTALKPMVETGMKGAELRVLGSKNIMDLSDAELETHTKDPGRGSGNYFQCVAHP